MELDHNPGDLECSMMHTESSPIGKSTTGSMDSNADTTDLLVARHGRDKADLYVNKLEAD